MLLEMLLKKEVDVVKNNIPLLISKGAMSKLERHEAELNSQVIKLQCNSSGHYCVPLTTLAGEN